MDFFARALSSQLIALFSESAKERAVLAPPPRRREADAIPSPGPFKELFREVKERDYISWSLAFKDACLTG